METIKLKNLENFNFKQLKEDFKNKIIEKNIDPNLLIDIFSELSIEQQAAVNKSTDEEYHTFDCEEEDAILMINTFSDYGDGYDDNLKEFGEEDLEMDLGDVYFPGSYFQEINENVDSSEKIEEFILDKNNFLDYDKMREKYGDSGALYWIEEAKSYINQCVYYTALQDAAKEILKK